jgi:hypothetical protein
MLSTLLAFQIKYNNGLDMSIESLSSRRFGVFVFIFLMIGIAVFSSIIYAVVRGEHGSKTRMRTGEKVMIGAIIMGVVVAILFAATQMIGNFLF